MLLNTKSSPLLDTENRLLDRIYQQQWVEDYGLEAADLRRVANALALHQLLAEELKHLPRRISLDGSEARRIAKVHVHATKFQKALREAIRHPGTEITLFGTFATANEGFRSEEEVNQGFGQLLSSPSDLARVCELALRGLGGAPRGAPGKVQQAALIIRVAALVMGLLAEHGSQSGAEAADVVRELVALVGVKVTRKRIQNVLAEHKSS